MLFASMRLRVRIAFRSLRIAAGSKLTFTAQLEGSSRKVFKKPAVVEAQEVGARWTALVSRKAIAMILFAEMVELMRAMVSTATMES